ncbi:hypothetical protein GCM10010873_16250 [Cypionkella aquatica]|uniref:ParB-like N-terminal domain-containing protein n=1 Tax=Cypionkella aquatica TaxID=1756042 RepID=A0AA37U715_9RHOB|nr:ParB N-terminal domain-containing protein [Cypionkella aquatica]GLS86651.1 hypothetical protein GCM10010873_16250 [Cypionkella aquatica]
MTEIHYISLDHIEVPSDRARDFDPAWAEGLAAVIAVQGLLHPIRVRSDGDGYRLIAGRVRLEAYRLLDRREIPATVSDAQTDDEALLEEVMENLGRAELIALDRCHHLHGLKQVWERLHPQSKRGGDKNVKKGKEGTKLQSLQFGEKPAEVFGFAEVTAKKIGLSARTIMMAVKIWSDLTPDSRQRLAGTPWAEKQSELMLLSGEKPKRQAEILDKLLAQNARVSSVADAMGLLNNGVIFDDVERKFLTANKVFGKLADPVLDRLIAANQERIVASLQRQGRI